MRRVFRCIVTAWKTPRNCCAFGSAALVADGGLTRAMLGLGFVMRGPLRSRWSSTMTDLRRMGDIYPENLTNCLVIPIIRTAVKVCSHSARNGHFPEQGRSFVL